VDLEYNNTKFDLCHFFCGGAMYTTNF